MHAGTMTPYAIASLATLAGLFIVLDARAGDQRLTLAGLRPGAPLSARLTIIGLAVLLVVVASLTVTPLVFDARQPLACAGGNGLLAATYVLLGVCLGPIFGRVSGVFIAFLVRFLDVGIGQSPMLRPEPASWARFLPGYGADRVLLDGGLTAPSTKPCRCCWRWAGSSPRRSRRRGVFRHGHARRAAPAPR